MTAPPPPPEKKELAVGELVPLVGQQAQNNMLNPVYDLQAIALQNAMRLEVNKPKPIGNIAKAISSVMSEIGVVAKEGVNQFHRYRYATIGDVLHKLTPLLGKHGLMIVQNEVSSELKGTRLAVVYEFSIAHSSGEVWPDKPRKTGMTVASDSKGNFDDKAYNKSATAARKYFLLELFQVPTGDMDDADSDAQSPAQPPAPPQSRAPVPPPPPPPRETAPNLATVDETKPHRIVLGKGSGAAAWAQAFIKAVGKAADENELQGWIETNSPIMANLATSHPDLYQRVQAATTTKHESFGHGPAVTDMMSGVPPDPAHDPDAAIDEIKARLASCTSQEELEMWWNANVAPTEEKWQFPPDWDLLMREFERNEVRIAAQEAK